MSLTVHFFHVFIAVAVDIVADNGFKMKWKHEKLTA